MSEELLVNLPHEFGHQGADQSQLEQTVGMFAVTGLIGALSYCFLHAYMHGPKKTACLEPMTYPYKNLKNKIKTK